MSRIIINKKKIRNSIIIKYFIIIIIIIFFILFFYWLLNKNRNISFISDYLELTSSKYNYVLKEVEIQGLINVPKNEINQYFLDYYDKSIFLLPIKEILKNIEANTWIKSVTINNNFKNKISITIKEAKPSAIYFNGSTYVLINNLGHIIDTANKEDIQQYIVLIGDQAKENALNLLEAIPSDLKFIIRRAEYVSKRRWDIFLNDNLKIKLPENSYKKSMDDFIEIYNNLSISDISKIDSIDLRISDRAIIKFIN